MAPNLTGKVALITGGAQGLGKTFAEQLLSRGAKVSLVDVNKLVGQKTERQMEQQYGKHRAMFVTCDVSNKTQLEAAFSTTRQRFGGLDIVVNNAGIADETNWEKTIAVNLNAVIHGSKLGMTAMRTDKGGKGGLIVNVASLAAMTNPPLMSAYCASKHGILGFSRSLAATYPVNTLGVRVCCLCPSFTDTNLMGTIHKALPDELDVPQKSLQQLENIVQMTGLMKLSDVATAFLRLVDDESTHGAVLLVTPAGQEFKFPRHLAGKL